MRWMHCLHHSHLLNDKLGLFRIFGFPWLHHNTSLTDVTMGTKLVFFAVGKEGHIDSDVTVETRAISLL
jgi:hypothetical protein